MDKNLETLEKYIIYSVAFLIPVSFLPIFPNYFTTVKLIILAAGVCLAILIKLTRMIVSGNFDISVTNFDFPVFLLAIAYLASSILRTPNKMEAFFLPGTAAILIFAAIYYFLVNQLKEKDKEYLLLSVFLSGIIVSLFSFFSITGIFSKISVLPPFLKDKLFTTLGGNLPTAPFLAVVIPLGISLVIAQKDVVKKAFFAISLGVVTFGLVLNIYNILPGKPTSPMFIDYKTSWSIAIDALKESPILGAGPGNYLTAFNRFRPITYNQTALWNIKFTAARNFFLTSITETGLIGMAALILLIYAVYKSAQKDIKERSLVGWNLMTNAKLISLVLLLVIFAFFSATLELIFLMLLLLAVNSKSKRLGLKFGIVATNPTESSDFAGQFAPRIPAILATLPILVGIIVLVVIGFRVVSAEYLFNNSINALAANDGTKTYTLMQQAINKNSTVDRYHATMAQVNLALANSIAQKPEGQQITEEERTTITQLIQQSINEGKAAVALNPTRSGNWELLAALYRSIMAFSEGADQFAIQAYSQSVALDPVNPLTRLNLGGVYYSVKDYDSAIDVFKLAVMAKIDYANAHYNLAIAYRENGDIEKAITEMTNVLSLVDRNTPDYDLAKKELDNLEAKKPVVEAVTPGTENLTPPQTNEQVVQPPIELPQGAEPPSPSPIGQETPVPNPTSTP